MKKVLASLLLVALARLRFHGTAAQWVERAQRLPLPRLRGAQQQRPPAPAERLQTRVLERVALELESEVVAIAEHGDFLYAGTFDQGALRIGPDGIHRLNIDARVNELVAGEAGAVYAATNGGAYEVSAAGAVRRLAPGAFAAVTMWRGQPVFASRGGLSFLEADGLRRRGPAQGVRADAPSALADCGAVLCIGASDGLWLFDGEAATHHSTAGGELPEEMVTAVARGEGDFAWAGTLSTGLARIPLSPGPAPFLPSSPDGRIAPHALLVREGAVIFGNPSGLLVIQGGRAGIVRELGPVTSLADSARGGFWAGAKGTVVRLELPQPLAEVRR